MLYGDWNSAFGKYSSAETLLGGSSTEWIWLLGSRQTTLSTVLVRILSNLCSVRFVFCERFCFVFTVYCSCCFPTEQWYTTSVAIAGTGFAWLWEKRCTSSRSVLVRLQDEVIICQIDSSFYLDLQLIRLRFSSNSSNCTWFTASY